MTRNAVLGLLVVAFALAGLVVGIRRVGPGSGALTWAIAAVAAAAGAAVFLGVAALGRRGIGTSRAKWLLIPGIVALAFVDRLPERWQLALLTAALGYVAAFVATVVARAVRLAR
jgi:hypothetical protein